MNPRDLWRPKYPELPQQCASCPFKTGSDFASVVRRLAKTIKARFSKAMVLSARIKIMAEAEDCGDFICHGSAYKPDMTMRPSAEFRQCPGATVWFRKHGERK